MTTVETKGGGCMKEDRERLEIDARGVLRGR
jgi:hypothetical protein